MVQSSLLLRWIHPLLVPVDNGADVKETLELTFNVLEWEFEHHEQTSLSAVKASLGEHRFDNRSEKLSWTHRYVTNKTDYRHYTHCGSEAVWIDTRQP